MGLHPVGLISNCSIKKTVVGVDRPAINALSCKQKKKTTKNKKKKKKKKKKTKNKKKKTKINCLNSYSCHFVKNHFFAIKFLHANVQRVYIMYS